MASINTQNCEPTVDDIKERMAELETLGLSEFIDALFIHNSFPGMTMNESKDFFKKQLCSATIEQIERFMHDMQAFLKGIGEQADSEYN